VGSVTAMRPARLWENPAQVQSTIAFARSSPVESRARWTVPQASQAERPFIVRPLRNCTTAAPRPIVAIVPLSWYANGLRGSPPPRAAGSLRPGPRPRLQRHGSELRQDLVGLGDPRDVADGVHLRVADDAEIGRDRHAPAVLEVHAEHLDDVGRLQARAPDE